MLTVLLVLLIIAAFGGIGWGSYYSGPGYVMPLGLVVLVLVLILLFSGYGAWPHWR